MLALEIHERHGPYCPTKLSGVETNLGNFTQVKISHYAEGPWSDFVRLR